MPDNDNTGQTVNASSRQGFRSWFAVPAPLKHLFDRFPLQTYPANDFPTSAARDASHHSLYIFTTAEDARRGLPSYNPGCLRWQTYLKITNIEFRTVPSSNHASPTGSLPFIITKPTVNHATKSQTISTKGIRKWIASQEPERSTAQELTDLRYETYQALIEGPLRVAWLYQLYICSANEPVVRTLYLESASSNPLVQATIAHQLRQAADAELRRTSFLRRKEETELWREVEDAFFALSTLLGDRTWFFGERASYFDASVFAYSHLILDTDRMNWQYNPLNTLLEKHANLVSHRERLLDMYH